MPKARRLFPMVQRKRVTDTVEDCAPLFFVPHAANTNTKLAQYAVRIAVTPL